MTLVNILFKPLNICSASGESSALSTKPICPFIITLINSLFSIEVILASFDQLLVSKDGNELSTCSEGPFSSLRKYSYACLILFAYFG